MMYGMKRTTIYLPDELKAALERTAAAEGRSEADVVVCGRFSGPRAYAREDPLGGSHPNLTTPAASP
jgi:hypothetical protein